MNHEATAQVDIGSMRANTEFLVTSLDKYDAYLGMSFLLRHKVVVYCDRGTIHFGNTSVSIIYIPITLHLKSAVTFTMILDFTKEFPEVFVTAPPDVLPLLREVNHKILFKDTEKVINSKTYHVS